jgi:beta-lactamase class A
MKARFSWFGVLALLVSLGCGYWLGQHKSVFSNSPSSQVLRENSPEYKFINPLLLTQSNNSLHTPSLSILESKIASFVTIAKGDKSLNDISVYYRQMNSGDWTGFNENGTYAPGSMLKVAILIGYLDSADTDQNILDTQYSYNPQIDEGQYYKPAAMLSPGKHDVRDLIKNMITESDNTATLILANQRPDIVEKVYKALALPNPQVGEDFMSPLQYSAFWRVLYNATYLTKPNSEEALDLLSLTTFNDGLVAGLPNGIKVAHKFGEHTNVEPNAPPVRELHDCGIIYPSSKSPYFLCVMTRGSDFKVLEKTISDVSKLVYETVTS